MAPAQKIWNYFLTTLHKPTKLPRMFDLPVIIYELSPIAYTYRHGVSRHVNRLAVVEATDARSQEDGRHEGAGPAQSVHHPGAAQVHVAQVLEPALLRPRPVRCHRIHESCNTRCKQPLCVCLTSSLAVET